MAEQLRTPDALAPAGALGKVEAERDLAQARVAVLENAALRALPQGQAHQPSNGTRLTRQAYTRLVAEDVAWLLRQPACLERDHIEMIIRWSIGASYGGPSAQASGEATERFPLDVAVLLAGGRVDEPAAAPAQASAPENDDCSSCGEECAPEGECPQSKRPCGHHCNCSWSHDACCWCGAEFGEEPSEPAAAAAASQANTEGSTA